MTSARSLFLSFYTQEEFAMIYEAAYDVKWEMEQMKSAIDYFRNTLNRGTDSWEEECEVEMSILNLESQLERLQDLCG